jgi:exodeoxyribonuclease VII small subunit
MLGPSAKGLEMSETNKTKLSFEEAYKQLMEIVKKMESGELPLADSVAAYEQGVKLKAYCEQLLKEAELKIEQVKIN